MATRARILADYVSSGVTAAEFDFLDTTSGTPGSGTFLRGDKTWQTAGTVIQTVSATYNSSNSDTINSSTFTRAEVSGAYPFGLEITGVLANSKVLIMMSFVGWSYRSEVSVAGGYGIFHGTSALTEPRYDANWDRREDGVGAGYHEMANQITLQYLHTTPDTGANHYYLGLKSASAFYTYVFGDASNPFYITLMEIA